MPKNKVITAIDIGTDKCVTLIATTDSKDSELRVVGVSAVPSKGMRKSVIVDLEQVVNTISESLDGAERMAGFDIKSAYVSIAGTHISSRNSKGVVAVASPEQEITRIDVERVIEAARAVSLSADQEIIHVVPRDFKVDSQAGIKDPVGMTGVRLESEAHIITGMTTSLKNLEKCLADLGLALDGFVFSGLASAEVALTETEKELGVVLVDIGAGTTSICAYVEGSLELSDSIPIGARHITQDIALGCRISLENAEKIKISLSEEKYDMVKPIPGESKEDLNKRRKKADQLDLQEIGVFESQEVLSKRTLVEGIMIPRMKEIFNLVAEKLEKNKIMNLVPAGLVLCGGGAETVQIADVAKRSLNLPARIGSPIKVQGLVSDISRPSYSSAVGVLVYGQSQGGGEEIKTSFSLGSTFEKVNILGIFDKIKKLIKAILP
jgi:cell division protein FtsA